MERYYNLSLSEDRFDHMVDYGFYYNQTTGGVESPVLYVQYGSGTIVDFENTELYYNLTRDEGSGEVNLGLFSEPDIEKLKRELQKVMNW